jgi:PAS domain S-box-containing protein
MNLSFDPDFYLLLSGAFARLVGKNLIGEAAAPADDAAAQARWLYAAAPFCVLAHNTEPDPKFVYANRAAQRCFEYDWDEIIGLPSRLSAPAPDRDERQRLLDAVTKDGFIGNYRGLRIAKSGRRFWIEHAVVWQLIDENGHLHGQAAMFQGVSAGS